MYNFFACHGASPSRICSGNFVGSAAARNASRGEDAGSLVVAVTVAGRTLKAGADHVRTERTNDAHHVGECDVMSAPLLEGLLRSLGEAKVGDAGKSLLHAVVAIGSEQLEGPQDTELVEQVAAKLVLSALAAVQGQLQGGDAAPAGLQRQHATVFVVRMRGSVHQSGRRVQAAQSEFKAGNTRVHGQAAWYRPRGRDLRAAEGNRNNSRIMIGVKRRRGWNGATVILEDGIDCRRNVKRSTRTFLDSIQTHALVAAVRCVEHPLDEGLAIPDSSWGGFQLESGGHSGTVPACL